MHVTRALLLLTLLLLWAPMAPAQRTVGEMLDAGAVKLSTDEFQRQLVQRVIVGPAATGGHLEMMYAENGTVEGLGNNPVAVGNTGTPIRGQWTFDERGRICTTMRYGAAVLLPTRCQWWFQLGDRYYFADSDTDRSAKVLHRTLKQ